MRGMIPGSSFICGSRFFFSLILTAGMSCVLLRAQAPAADGAGSAQEVRELRQLVEELRARVTQLENERKPASSVSPPAAPAPVRVEKIGPTNSAEDRGVLDSLRGVTVNVGVDGYYAYNFNRPVGRVNLLRAYDASSNSFGLNQAGVVIERTPDVAAGRRFGARVDLQFGQATEALQGNAFNELRPQAYRTIYQAFGTYVAPIGSGLSVDFGKWASGLGMEGNYSKDQINYSRSLLFTFLPAYHMGLRATYNATPAIAVSYWLVNGANQAEDFNGFKSQNVQLALKPHKTVNWVVNYYTGREQRNVVADLNPGIPTQPTQAGMPVGDIVPAPDGRTRIVDSYLIWTPNAKLTLAGQTDYSISRMFKQSPAAHLAGGAAYVRYQFTPKAALAGRAEYVSDPGGLFTGVSQAIKETTATFEYRLADGVLMRYEWRRDFSNQPFFLTDAAGTLSKRQNTASIGLIWWWGRKEGAW